jgi:hypothetical protein
VAAQLAASQVGLSTVNKSRKCGSLDVSQRPVTGIALLFFFFLPLPNPLRFNFHLSLYDSTLNIAAVSVVEYKSTKKSVNKVRNREM